MDWNRAKNPNEKNSDSNPYAFSDGVEVNNTGMLLKWGDQMPYYGKGFIPCVYLLKGRLYTQSCNYLKNVVCRIPDENCGDTSGDEECPENSKSGRSRVNFPVFAVFLAVSIFKSFYALVGPVA